ncbi:MAG: sulfotransferase [Actinomycetota bacterium]|nr:sulfotransferase [Actinomycetota bacterium]
MSQRSRELRRSLRTDFHPSLKLRLIRSIFRLRQASHLPALVLGRRLREPIFIIGAPRSGTSLLYAILRDSSQLAHWPGEAHEVWEADYHPALRQWESNALGASDLTPRAASRIRTQFLLTAGPRKRLVDKTPRNSLRVGFVDALFPDARFVFLQRDGRDNVNSLINAWRTPRYRTYRLPAPHSIPGTDPNWWKFVLYPGWKEDSSGPLETVCAKQWKSCNESALGELSVLGESRWIGMRYERLIESPEDEMQRMSEFLGLDFNGRLRAAVRARVAVPINTVTPPETGKWRRENPEQIASIMPLITPTMEALGYR